MPIDLTEFERGHPYKGDVAGELAALQHRLGRAQLSQIVHQRRLIIVIEGPEGGGKRDFVKLLGAALDPTHFALTTVSPDRRRARDGHWLARFWAKLPEAGDTAIFYHSWYRRVLEDNARFGKDLRDKFALERGFRCGSATKKIRSSGGLFFRLHGKLFSARRRLHARWFD